jgi:hypothetical protein
MAIIRDEETGGIAMIPLFVEWGVHRCNVIRCTEVPTTIVTNLDPNCGSRVGIIAGFCEKHFQEASKEGGTNFILVDDDFDAFEYARIQKATKELQDGNDAPKLD